MLREILLAVAAFLAAFAALDWLPARAEPVEALAVAIVVVCVAVWPWPAGRGRG